MMSLLFALLLAAALLILRNREKPALAVWAVAMAVGLFWFHHHATSVLTIQL